MPWPDPDPSACAICLAAGIVPLTDVPGRVDYAVCRCAAGKRWRHSQQISKDRSVHSVTPHWQTWAAEHGIPLRESVRSGKAKDNGSAIDLIEKWEGRRTPNDTSGT